MPDRRWVDRVQAWVREVPRGAAPRGRVAAWGSVAGLLAAVTVLRWFVDGAGQAAALLYVVPIALAALRFGRRGGLAVTGLATVAFCVLQGVRSHGDVDVTGWVGPLLAMALIGGLVGNLRERAAQHEASRRILARHLADVSDAQRTAAEASDAIVQHVAAARWMLEAGDPDRALAALDDTVVEGIAQVGGALPPPGRFGPTPA